MTKALFRLSSQDSVKLFSRSSLEGSHAEEFLLLADMFLFLLRLMRYLKREFGLQYGELPEGFQKPEFRHSLFEYGDVDYGAMANICKPITLGESDFFLHSTSSEGYIKFEPDQPQLQPSDSKWPDFDAWEAFKKSVRPCLLASWILTPSIIWRALSG